MKKGMKNIAVKIFVTAFVLLIGNDVRALTFWDFYTAIRRPDNETINLSAYDNPLTFEISLDDGAVSVAGNKTLIGLRGNDFAILEGNSNYNAFEIVNKTLQFYDNFEFRLFDGDKLFDAFNGSIINFTSATFKFINNEVSAITANKFSSPTSPNPVNINFTSSTVIFENNKQIGHGAALRIIYGSNVNVMASTVNFINNNITVGANRDGGTIYASGGANINFTDSIVHFTSNTTSRHGGAISANEDSNINFTDSIVHFTSNSALQNKGSAIYADNHSTILFVNTKVSFIENANGPALYAAAWSEINISGDMEFRDNRDGDIWLEEGSSFNLSVLRGKSVRVQIGALESGLVNTIRKAGDGDMIFISTMSLKNVDLYINHGAVLFETISSTFNKINISSAGILGISIDFAVLADGAGISSFYVDDFIIDDGILSLQTIGERSPQMTSAAFIHVANAQAQPGLFSSISGGSEYSFSWQDRGGNKYVGFLTFGESSGGGGLLNSSIESAKSVFIINAIRQSAISDNSPIYSNVKEKVWVLPQFSGGSLSDDDGAFKNSNAGVKGGFTFVEGKDFSAGAFAGFASRSYKQGDNKATASDMDFGFYGSYGLKKVDLAGFVGYGLQSVKADGVEFDANVIKFGARAEYDAGSVSPFVGLEGAMVDIGDVDLGGATLEAASYTRLSSQLGAKISRQFGKLSWYGKAYIDLLLAGAKPEYSVKPDVEGAKSVTVDGTAESVATFGLGGGVSLPVSNAVNVFAAVDIKLNSDYFGYQTNVGASFKF